jgi:hypothetical protein
MRRRRFPAASAEQRRNAQLFFADLMGPQSVTPAGVSQARLEADRFLADLLGEPSMRALAQGSPHALVHEPAGRGSGRMLARRLTEPQRFLPPGQMSIALSQEEWGEGGSCPSRDEIEGTWRTLALLSTALKKTREEIESNPLVIEVQMLEKLMDVLDMAKEVPSKVWAEIWKELKAFASCDVKPLVARVKAGEKHANAVLRVLHGLTSILQGYVHDRIDARFKSKLEAQKGWSKAVAKLLIHVIKKQVPVIQREIKAGNFAAVATAFEDLKTELGGPDVSVTGVWGVIVALGKEIIGKAIDDALKNSARWAAKKVGKKLLGSAAKAASVIFILEDIALLVHALLTISDYKEKLREFNRVVLGFLARVRPCPRFAVSPGKTYPARVGWKNRRFARLDCQIFIHSFAPVQSGKPGEGEWLGAPLKTVFEGRRTDIARIEVPPSEPAGERILPFQVPPVAQWPAKGDSYVSVHVSEVDVAGRTLRTWPLFVAACVP